MDMKIRGLEDIIRKPQPDFSRLLKVLARDGKPDFVPFYELFVNSGTMEKLLGKKITCRESTVEFYYKAGYALGSGNSIPDYVPVQNYLKMLEVGWRGRI